MTRPTPRKNLIPVNDPSEIPAFETEAKEHEYWKIHELGPGMFENVEPDPLLEQIPTRPRTDRTRPVPVRFDEDTLRRLRTRGSEEPAAPDLSKGDDIVLRA